MTTISPQTRTGRTQATDTIRPGPRTVRDHHQSTQMAASKNCQRQGTQTVRKQSAVAYADWSRTPSERKLSVSANSPRSCLVRANGRVHEQPMSATKHGLGQSVNRQRQWARIIRNRSAVAWERARESGFDCGSPVAASRSFRPVSHRLPPWLAARLREFASM